MDGSQDRADMDQLARNQAALAAQARARQVAGGIAAAHADNAYNQARRNAAGYAARFPNGRQPMGHSAAAASSGRSHPGNTSPAAAASVGSSSGSYERSH